MIQAQNFTVGTIYGQAIEALKIPDHERYGLTYQLLVDYVHDAVLQWFSSAQPVVKAQYRQRLPVSGISSFGVYNSASGGNYTASSQQLSIAAASFTSAALGASVLIFDGSHVYRGTVSEVVSGTVVVLTGLELPASNVSSAQALIWGRTQDIAIGSLALAEITSEDGIPSNLSLESDSLGEVPFLGQAAYKYILANAASYTKAVFASLYGDTIKIFVGSAVASVGNLTLIAPLQPAKASASTTLLSVPDNFCPDVADLVTIRIARHLTQQPDQAVANRAREILNAYGILKAENRDEAK